MTSLKKNIQRRQCWILCALVGNKWNVNPFSYFQGQGAAVMQRCEEVIVMNTKTCLLHPQVFGEDFQPCKQFIDLMLTGAGDRGECLWICILVTEHNKLMKS